MSLSEISFAANAPAVWVPLESNLASGSRSVDFHGVLSEKSLSK